MKIEDLPEFIQKLLEDKPTLVCPITHSLFVDPVFVDGRTFERNEIKFWFRKSNKNPITGEVIPPEERKNLKTNFDVKSAVFSWKEKVTVSCLKYFNDYFRQISLYNNKNDNETKKKIQKVILPILEKLLERAYELSPKHDTVLKNGVLLYDYMMKFYETNQLEVQTNNSNKNYLERRDFFILLLSKHHSLLQQKRIPPVVQEEEEEEDYDDRKSIMMEEMSDRILSLEEKVKNQEKEIETLKIQNYGHVASNRELFDRIKRLEGNNDNTNSSNRKSGDVFGSPMQKLYRAFDDIPIPTSPSNFSSNSSSSSSEEKRKKRDRFEMTKRRVGNEAYEMYRRRLEEQKYEKEILEKQERRRTRRKNRRTRRSRRLRRKNRKDEEIIPKEEEQEEEEQEQQKKSSWRIKHEVFQAMLREVKNKKAAAEGFKKPFLGNRRMMLVPCPTCGRKFSKQAASRHLPICMKICSKK